MPKFDLAGNPLPEDGPATPPVRPATPPPPAQAPAPSPGLGTGGAAQYDLAGNPIGGGAGAAASSYGTPPSGYAAPQAGTWPPPPVGGNPYEMGRNDSGEKAGVPPEIAALKWNWGAFALTWLWCLNHRLIAWGVGILLGSFVVGLIPFGGLLPLIVSIYFGVMGHKMGWQNRRFEGGLPQFFDVQRAWMRWGVALTVISFTFGVLGAILFPVFMKARLKAQQMQNGGYSQPYGSGNFNGGGKGGFSPNVAPSGGQ